MKRTLLSLMLLVASLASFAYGFEVNGIYYNVLFSEDALTCEVTKGDSKYTGEVIIPKQVSYSGKVFNVTSIGEYAFNNCSALTSVTIPNSVTSIEKFAFLPCSGIEEIQSLATTPPSCVSTAFSGINKTQCVLKVPGESIDAYKAANEWKDFFNIVALENDPSAIGGIHNTDNATPADYFSTNGYRSNKPFKGMNIIRMSDGTIRKVIAQ